MWRKAAIWLGVPVLASGCAVVPGGAADLASAPPAARTGDAAAAAEQPLSPTSGAAPGESQVAGNSGYLVANNVAALSGTVSAPSGLVGGIGSNLVGGTGSGLVGGTGSNLVGGTGSGLVGGTGSGLVGGTGSGYRTDEEAEEDGRLTGSQGEDGELIRRADASASIEVEF